MRSVSFSFQDLSTYWSFQTLTCTKVMATRKRALILQGAQGSGKSTFAQSFTGAKICSADTFFEGPNGYEYEPGKIAEAHALCLRTYVEALQAGSKNASGSLVIVDNTNAQRWEMNTYVQLAKAYDFEVEIHTFLINPKVAFERNVHQVPLGVVLRTATLMESPLASWGIHVKHYPDGTSSSR